MIVIFPRALLCRGAAVILSDVQVSGYFTFARRARIALVLSH
jgi:hypothetical protein